MSGLSRPFFYLLILSFPLTLLPRFLFFTFFHVYDGHSLRLFLMFPSRYLGAPGVVGVAASRERLGNLGCFSWGRKKREKRGKPGVTINDDEEG